MCKIIFLLPPLHIFPLLVLFFLSWVGYTRYLLRNPSQMLTTDRQLFYWVMICQWVEKKGPEIALKDNSQMPPSFPPLIFIQLLSSIRFKMN